MLYSSHLDLMIQFFMSSSWLFFHHTLRVEVFLFQLIGFNLEEQKFSQGTLYSLTFVCSFSVI